MANRLPDEPNKIARSRQDQILFPPVTCPACGKLLEPWFGSACIQYRHCGGTLRVYRNSNLVLLLGTFRHRKPDLPPIYEYIESVLAKNCRWCGKTNPSHKHFYEKTGRCRTVGKSLIRRKKIEAYNLWSGRNLDPKSPDLLDPDESLV